MRNRLLVAAAVLALVVAACSSDDSSSSSSDGSRSRTSDATPGSGAPEASAGCDATDAVAPGEEKVTTTSGGTERWYTRHVPQSYDPATPMPVVLDLHGYAEGATVHALMSDLGDYGEEQGFITITPQGSGAVPRWDVALDSPDLDYIGDLLEEVDETLCVDTRRVYSTGLSNGAFLTSAVSCRYSDRIAAAAPVAGIRNVDGCKETRPVPVVAFHGTDDTFVSYDGGFGSSIASLPAPDGSGRTIGQDGRPPVAPGNGAQGPTIEEITATWAERNGCSAKRTEEKVASDVTRIAFACPKGAEAVLYRVEGGGHSWPGSAFSKQVAAVVGPTTDSISANEIMWEFFRDHPLPAS